MGHGKKDSIAVLLVVACLVTSCASYQRCQDKFGEIATDTVYTVDSTRVITMSDSIRHVLDTSRYIVRETERTRLIVHRDTIVCTSKADTVHHYVKTKEIIKQPVFKDKKPKCPWLKWVVVGFVTSLLFMALFKILI